MRHDSAVKFMHIPLDEGDARLIEAARATLERNFHRARHTVAAAVLCSSGRIYTGINIESLNGPCAESVAMGAAFTNGERDITAIVSVTRRRERYPVLSPCGNCRQMMVRYAPEAMVIFDKDGEPAKTRAKNLLPNACRCYPDLL